MAQKYTIIQKIALAVSALCFAFTVALVVAYGEPGSSSGSSPSKKCSDGSMALIMSQGFVKRELKSPSTAKFPSIHKDGVRVDQLGECKFRVSAYVDAQNGFGATVRTRYVMDIAQLPDTQSWRSDGLVMQ